MNLDKLREYKRGFGEGMSFHGMKLDMTISVGTVIQIISLVLAILYSSNRVENRITSLEVKVDTMWSAFRSGGIK